MLQGQRFRLKRTASDVVTTRLPAVICATRRVLAVLARAVEVCRAKGHWPSIPLSQLAGQMRSLNGAQAALGALKTKITPFVLAALELPAFRQAGFQLRRHRSADGRVTQERAMVACGPMPSSHRFRLLRQAFCWPAAQQPGLEQGQQQQQQLREAQQRERREEQQPSKRPVAPSPAAAAPPPKRPCLSPAEVQSHRDRLAYEPRSPAYQPWVAPALAQPANTPAVLPQLTYDPRRALACAAPEYGGRGEAVSPSITSMANAILVGIARYQAARAAEPPARHFPAW